MSGEEEHEWYLGSGPGVVKAGGDEHTAMAVDDESSVVVAHVEGFEEVRREGMVDGRHNQEDGEDESESERHHIPTSLRRTRLSLFWGKN